LAKVAVFSQSSSGVFGAIGQMQGHFRCLGIHPRMCPVLKKPMKKIESLRSIEKPAGEMPRDKEAHVRLETQQAGAFESWFQITPPNLAVQSYEDMYGPIIRTYNYLDCCHQVILTNIQGGPHKHFAVVAHIGLFSRLDYDACVLVASSADACLSFLADTMAQLIGYRSKIKMISTSIELDQLFWKHQAPGQLLSTLMCQAYSQVTVV